MAAKIAPNAMFNTLLGARGAEELAVTVGNDAAVFQTLDIVGRDMIMEQLATGRLPAEVALMYQVPILSFRRWMADRITDIEMDAVREAAAESLQLKALLTLSADLQNPAQASQAKALSERMARISESLDPKGWNPNHAEPRTVLPSITIAFNGLGITLDMTQQPPVSSPHVQPRAVAGSVFDALHADNPEQDPSSPEASVLDSAGEDGVWQISHDPRPVHPHQTSLGHLVSSEGIPVAIDRWLVPPSRGSTDEPTPASASGGE